MQKLLRSDWPRHARGQLMRRMSTRDADGDDCNEMRKNIDCGRCDNLSYIFLSVSLLAPSLVAALSFVRLNILS